MAASGTAGTPFFGSKISLISKSEIRYEGLLYAIDAKESTIALAKVKSFGSEDRTVERPVPPRDDIFQLIIFRASDIKDLIVDDPTPQSTASALADPAIVQAHASSTTSFPSSFPQPSSINQVQQQLRGVKTEQASSSQGSSVEAKPKTAASVLQGLNKQSKPQAQQSSQVGGSRQVVNKPPQLQQHSQGNQQQHGGQQAGQQQANHQQGGARSEQRSNNLRRNDGRNEGRQNQAGSNQREYQPRNNNTGGSGYRSYNMVAGGGNRNFGGGERNFNSGERNYSGDRHFSGGGGDRRPQQNGGGPGGYNNRNPRNGLRGSIGGLYRGGPGGGGGIKFANTPLPDSDFDFEKAQLDFKILEEKMAEMKVNGTSEDGEQVAEEHNEEEEDKEPTYNKTKSFFDTISCEALEREKGVQRPDWKNERKLNRETFGLISQPRNTYFNRGNNRYGGGGFRPNFRRPGGFQNRSGGNGRPMNRNSTPQQQQSQQPSSTTNGAVGGGAAKPQVKPNGVTSSSNAASSAAILAAVTGGTIVSPAKN